MADKTRYLKGHFLLDSGELSGSFFARTAVLLCQHDADGAFGLILNRATEKKVGDVLLSDLPDALREAPLFLGGPVQPSALSYVHADRSLLDGNVLPNLSLGHSLEQLTELGESLSSSSQIRIFAGYAGWSPGQLESELKRKAWLTLPATVELVFHAPAEQLWRTLVRLKGGWRNRLLATLPDDPSLN